jgi:hypothetical protein
VKRILYTIAFFVFTNTACLAAPAKAIPVVQYERNSVIPERNFDKEKLTKTKANPDFKYDLTKKLEKPSWFDKLFYKIVRFILKVLFNPTGSVESIFFYVICTALIIALVVVIMKMNAVGIFSRGNAKDRNGLDFSEFVEDINSIDFDKMIEEAVSSGMYRRAVRLYYLKSLKHLSDKEHIIWEINKTNRDYLYELRSPSLRTGFEGITYVYEYVWYGNIDIDSDKFAKVKVTFHEFHIQTAATK